MATPSINQFNTLFFGDDTQLNSGTPLSDLINSNDYEIYHERASSLNQIYFENDQGDSFNLFLSNSLNNSDGGETINEDSKKLIQKAPKKKTNKSQIKYPKKEQKIESESEQKQEDFMAEHSRKEAKKNSKQFYACHVYKFFEEAGYNISD